MEKYRNFPFISMVLVTANVMVYLLCALSGNRLYHAGDLSVYGVVAQREYGRLITSMFLHGDFGHIFNNMLILFFMGAMIEKEIGHIRYILFYFLSGIGANCLSLLVKIFNHDSAPSIGASGAVFGLDGVLLSLVLFSKHTIPRATPARVGFMIFYSLYSGLTGQNIDNAAHIGGLLVGFLAGTVMCIAGRRKRNQR
ncbi:MAG: rhomboid family intramembrane serine protease [Clostridium sp.]|nr:rhomboid family intramembrane serine protease [Clostridium sp.]